MRPLQGRNDRGLRTGGVAPGYYISRLRRDEVVRGFAA